MSLAFRSRSALAAVARRAASHPSRPASSRAAIFASVARNTKSLGLAAPSGKRPFSSDRALAKGIMPDSSDPVKEPVASSDDGGVQVRLSDGEYHQLADKFMELLQTRFEEIQDKRTDVDVEYSDGVLTVVFGGKSTYVINKQPPNKQIWLSSPISGPSRYDWFVFGESQNHKEGTATGAWVNARNGGTLSDVFLEELGVNISVTTFD